MRVFILRHGQTTGDLEDRYGGDYDDELTPQGQKQAAELAEQLVDANISTFFVSPKKRAVQTAAIIAKTIPAEMVSIQDIRERNQYGVMTGLTKKEAKKKFLDEVEELEANNPYHKVKGSEEYFAFAERVLTAFNELVTEEFEKESEAIAFITHGGPIIVFFREVLGFELKGIKDCALFELEYDGEGYEIISADDVDSMEAGLK